jgi:hypothetical protein
MATQLKDFLPSLLKKDESWQTKLLCSWSSIIGSLHTRVRLEKINNDTLVLGVYDACWMQELYLLTPTLISTINQNLDQPRIKHLRFTRAVAKKEKKRTPIPEHQEPTPYVLNTTQQKALSAIADPHLRQALHNFLIRCNKEM